MSSADQILQFIISGLTVGSIYALIALGFTIIYNATEVINFAQGEFVMLGGMLTAYFYMSVHLPLYLAVILAILIVTAVGMLIEKLAISPLQKAEPITIIITTIGISFLLKGIAKLFWGVDPMPVPAFSGEEPISVFGANILPQDIWIMGVTLAICIALFVLYNFTIIGKGMRACAENRKAANLVGINPRIMILISFATSAAIGAMAGVIIAPKTMTSYEIGTMLGLKGFCAAILGGLGSVVGSVLGGLALGIFEAFGAGLISSQYKDAIAFIILLVVLLVKMAGHLEKFKEKMIKLRRKKNEAR